jgi:hypothetical protein
MSYTVLVLAGYVRSRLLLFARYHGNLLIGILLQQGNFIVFAYCAGKLMETPGYFVHQWDVRLGDLITVGYVSLCDIYGCYEVLTD